MWRYLIIVFGFCWLVQGYLAYKQYTKFMERIHRLRKQGAVGIGRTNRWHSKVIVVLTADSQEKIVCGEVLQGLTVLASLKPIKGISGLTMSDLATNPLQLPGNIHAGVLQAVDEIRKIYAQAPSC